MKTNMGWEMPPPQPLCILPEIKCSRKCAEKADLSNICASVQVLTLSPPSPHSPKNSIYSSAKRKQDPQLVQLNTAFRKKQDPLKIVLSCNVPNYKDIQYNSFLFIFKIRKYD